MKINSSVINVSTSNFYFFFDLFPSDIDKVQLSTTAKYSG